MNKQLTFSFLVFATITNSFSFAKDKVPPAEIDKNLSSINVTGEYYLDDPSFQGNKKIKNFTKAKSILKKSNHFGIKEELYCGCEFFKGKIPKDAKCGLKARKNQNRAFKIEFEHIVPFENQVGHTVAWDYGVPACKGKKGRNCASKVFPHLEADLWNLWPSAGELNADRNNFSYAMVVGPRNQYGKCDFALYDRKIEPRDEVKALVAFTYMYMQRTYGKVLRTKFISDKNEKLFQAWGRMALTKEQCQWAKKVSEVQGNKNVDLLEACQKQGK